MSLLTMRQYIGRVVVTLALIGLALLLWQMRHILILVFGGVLVSVILNLIAEPLHKRLGLPHMAALLISLLFVVALIGGAAWLFGGEVKRQIVILREDVPEAWVRFERWLGPSGIGDALESVTDGQGIVSRVGSVALSVGSGLADALLVLFAGVYIAARPQLYRSGVLQLLPEGKRPLVGEALDESGDALRRWLKGQLVAMAIVGLLTGVGLWLLGVPAALTLGILAALLDFVPFVGPVLAAIPGVLIAFTQSPTLALWTLGLYLLIQQIEGNLVSPLIQQRAVDLPPALLLFSLVAGGFLFGFAGVLLAVPLTVVLFVMVKRLYVREALRTPEPPSTERS